MLSRSECILETTVFSFDFLQFLLISLPLDIVEAPETFDAAAKCTAMTFIQRPLLYFILLSLVFASAPFHQLCLFYCSGNKMFDIFAIRFISHVVNFIFFDFHYCLFFPIVSMLCNLYVIC